MQTPKYLFDDYLIVDWSAASKPKTGADSIWIALLSGSENRVQTWNPSTREKAMEIIRSLLVSAVEGERRVLCGMDFPYGYPAGTADLLQLRGGKPWKAIWRHLSESVRDRPDNSNNRFRVGADFNERSGLDAGPFWGCPRSQADDKLTMKKPPWTSVPVPEYRITETRIRGPQPTWKLAYTGSVGSQALTGIPRLRSLTGDPVLAARTLLWPFDTGMVSPWSWKGDWRICHAEIYPSLVARKTHGSYVKDEYQVRALAAYFAARDRNHLLGELFTCPGDLDEVAERRIVDEEGWILGVR